MVKQVADMALPSLKIVITGEGRVAGGAKEILDAMGVKGVTPDEFINKNHDHAIYCQLGVLDYNQHKDGKQTEEAHFFKNPKEYQTAFTPFLDVSDIFVSCHFWDPRAPKLFTKEELRGNDCKLQVIADISCDIDGSVPTTLEASTIEEPFYGYNKKTGDKGAPFDEDSITIMAVDNLPCELPRDSSEGFGSDLVKDVLPHLLGDDTDGIIVNSSITKDGELTKKYSYLRDYASA
jgi:hypothetical protein